jgi:DNA-directed RNA polymerase specialized sigma24 family protein
MQRVRYADKAVKSAQEALENALLNVGIQQVGSGEGGRSSMPGDPTQRQALLIDDLRGHLAASQAYWGNLITEAEKAVESLSDARESACLRYYYFCGHTWEETARLMCVDVRTVYRIHGWALQHLQVPEEYQ